MDGLDKDERRVQALRETLRLYAVAAQDSEEAPSAEERHEAERQVVGLSEVARVILAIEPDD